MSRVLRECKENNALTVKRTAPLPEMRIAGVMAIVGLICLLCVTIWRNKRVDNLVKCEELSLQ
jgi:hypothetical protein